MGQQRHQQKTKGGERKYGRNKDKCAIYRVLRKRERSHVKRIERHMERYKDNSPMAREALERYRQLIVTK